MSSGDFYGGFHRATEISKADSRYIGSRVCMIGAEVKVVIERGPEDQPMVRLTSMQDQPLGGFDEEYSAKLERFQASGRELRAFVSAVGFSEATEFYWAEYAVFATDPADHDAWDKYLVQYAEKLSKGVHVDPNLGGKAVKMVLESGGTWCEPHKVGFPKLPRGEVYVKKDRSASDRLISAAISGNMGCLIISWIFFIALCAAIIFGIYWLFFK